MYPVWVVGVLFGILLLWLLILSYFFFQEKQYLKKLFPKASDGDIRKKLEEVILALGETKRQEQNMHRALRNANLEGLGHISRVESLRYNPYNDTGGDQSFTLVFLDAKQNGVILTSLHSRAGTRVYIKSVTKGKSDMELSKEEKQVLDRTVN